MTPANLRRYLDAAETTNNTTLGRAMAWDNVTSPMSEPLRVLHDCVTRFRDCFGRDVRRLLLSPAALEAVLTHPTSRRMAEAAIGEPQLRLGRHMLALYLVIAPEAIEEDEALGPHVLILGELTGEVRELIQPRHIVHDEHGPRWLRGVPCWPQGLDMTLEPMKFVAERDATAE